jgi:DNA-directed RNA polymerase specialized sigma24 family protein
MDASREESDIREFYQRWSAMVFTFCRFYLGDEGLGEAATAQAFSKFLTRGLPRYNDHLPLGLLRSALQSVRHFHVAVPHHELQSDLSHVVLSLPPEDRAVFILRGLLRLHFRWIAAAAGVSRQRVQQLWVRGLIRVRCYFPGFEPRNFWQTSWFPSGSFVALATGRLM